MNIRKAIARAISLSEHIYKQNIISGHLCIRTGNIEHPRVKSFYLHPITNFACEIPTIGPIQEVIEYTPDTIYFKLRDSTLVLEINLDLFEMLYRILAGYSPSLNELKGSFQNLIMFKNQLTNYNYDRLLLTEDEINFYQVRKTEDNRLVMEPVIGGL